MILRAALRTLHEVLYAADRYDRDDEEKRDKEHSLFLSEVADSATMSAAHLLRRYLRAPGKKVRADDEKEKHIGPPFSARKHRMRIQ